MFPPGRSRLGTTLSATGSTTTVNTIGMSVAAFLAARAVTAVVRSVRHQIHVDADDFLRRYVTYCWFIGYDAARSRGVDVQSVCGHLYLCGNWHAHRCL